MGDREEEVFKDSNFIYRRQEYQFRVNKASLNMRRHVRHKLETALVREFGNDSEKFGIDFGLWPLWCKLS